MKFSTIVPGILFVLASSANAQSVCGVDPDNPLLSFGINGVLSRPDCPVDFTYLDDLFVFGAFANFYDPIQINDLNVTIDNFDDINEPMPSSVD